MINNAGKKVIFHFPEVSKRFNSRLKVSNFEELMLFLESKLSNLDVYQLQNITHLNLMTCDISFVKLEKLLGNISQLKELNLSCAKLNESSAGAFNLSSLRKLNLINVSISQESLKKLLTNASGIEELIGLSGLR